MSIISEQKELLRQEMKRKRKELSEKEYKTLSENICQNLEQFSQVNIVAAFLPMHKEPDITPFLRKHFESSEKTLLLPKWEKGSSKMTFHQVEKWDSFPELFAEVFDLADIEIILVPGLAFDFTGHRLGYGKGYFDHFLQNISSRTHVVGVCFSFQVVSELPQEPHDQKVQQVVTEKGIIFDSLDSKMFHGHQV